jgi:hypothetical protein
MPLLDDAKKCYVGTTPITKVMAQGVQVWPKGTDSAADIQFLVHCDKLKPNQQECAIAKVGPWVDISAMTDPVSPTIDSAGRFGNCVSAKKENTNAIACRFRKAQTQEKNCTLDFWFYRDWDDSVLYQTPLIFEMTYRNYFDIQKGSAFRVGVIGTNGKNELVINCIFVNVQETLVESLVIGDLNFGWNHIAATFTNRSNSIICQGFVNGIGNGNMASVPHISTEPTYLYYLLCGMYPPSLPAVKFDEVRICSGIRYNADFTPPTEPYFPPDE